MCRKRVGRWLNLSSHVTYVYDVRCRYVSPTTLPVLAHCAGRPNTLLPCRRACWVPVGGYQTCIGIRPWTLCRGHRYPISSTLFADTVWYVRPWCHPLGWCVQRPLRSYPYQCPHRSQSGAVGSPVQYLTAFVLHCCWVLLAVSNQWPAYFFLWLLFLFWLLCCHFVQRPRLAL